MRKISSETRHKLQGYVFISPFIIGFFLLFLSPLVRSIQLSFSNMTSRVGMDGLQYTGFSHYINAFVGDIEFVPIFLEVIQDTLIQTPLILVFSLIIAIMINKKIKCKGLFRVIFFLPFLLGTGYVLQQLLDLGLDQMAVSRAREILLPAQLESMVGGSVVKVLEGFLSRITVILWRCGVQIVIFLTGLQGISPSLYESARCDSATEWEIFWKITLPMMTPIIFLNMVYTIIDMFNDSSNPMVNYFIDTAFKKNQITYASALSWIYFSFIAVLLAVVFAFMGRIIKKTVG